MSTDANAWVAVAGVVGGLGTAALTLLVGLRQKRLEAETQHMTRIEERAARASAEKLATYVRLNAAARDYRSVGHDYVKDRLDGVEPETFERIEEARAKYRKVYARAQMILPDRVFQLATEVNECLGQSYRALHDLDRGGSGSITYEKLHSWYDKQLDTAVQQLRYVLREDLTVGKTKTDVASVVQELQEERRRLWPAESERADSQEDSL